MWLAAGGLLLPLSAAAQTTATAAQTPPSAAAPAATAPDPDLQFVADEPDFTLAALPTSLRMPAGKLDFGLTHRFERPIASGSTGDFFSNFFGFDNGAVIGIQLRYGIAPGTAVTFNRTSDRTIEFLGQRELIRQSESRPITVDFLAGVEGLNNLRQNYASTLGAIVSHRISGRGAVYLEPMVVIDANANTIATTPTIAARNNTGMVGLGSRMRICKSKAYVVGEWVPRFGYDPGVDHISFGIEAREGGHLFQLNFSNTFATTMGQIARGGATNSDWYIGFNLTRRFF